MKLATFPRYLLADDFEKRSENLSMRRSTWTIASSLSQLQLETSFKDFCISISLPENEASSAILELLAHRLIYENLSSPDESLQKGKSVDELLKGSFSTLAIGVLGNRHHEAQNSQAANSPTAIQVYLGECPQVIPEKHTIQGWISNANVDQTSAPNPLNEQKPSQALNPIPTNSRKSNRKLASRDRALAKGEQRRYKLAPIISQIEKLSKGGIDSTVLAYQVFLKVPPDLLQDEGIESLHLVDANTEFTNQKLCQAIIRATTELTGYNLKIDGYNQ